MLRWGTLRFLACPLVWGGISLCPCQSMSDAQNKHLYILSNHTTSTFIALTLKNAQLLNQRQRITLNMIIHTILETHFWTPLISSKWHCIVLMYKCILLWCFILYCIALFCIVLFLVFCFFCCGALTIVLFYGRLNV